MRIGPRDPGRELDTIGVDVDAVRAEWDRATHLSARQEHQSEIAAAGHGLVVGEQLAELHAAYPEAAECVNEGYAAQEYWPNED